MLKKSSLIILFFPVMAIIAAQLSPSKQLHGFGTAAYGQSPPSNSSSGNDVIERYSHLSAQQLLDTANYYFNRNITDTALICYSLIINTPVKEALPEREKTIIDILNKSGIIYYWMSDYRSSYDYLIRALLLCEKTDYASYEPRIYNNIGNIYSQFNKYDMAKLYYSKALSSCQDTIGTAIILNNLGELELNSGKIDSAFYHLNKSLQISKQHNDIHLSAIQNSIALIYQKEKQYDSAFYYFRSSLEEAKKNHKLEYEAENLSCLGKLFFEVNKVDSALSYINLSNTIAKENDLLDILTKNYLTLSKINESKEDIKKAFEHYKAYVNLKDSVFNAEKFGEINQLQRLYEVAKTNQQIEQLYVNQQIKERTIRYQKIILFIIFDVLLLVSGVLLFVFFQNRKLNRAYKALFEKNLKIIELQENTSEKQPEKYQKSALTDAMQQELLDKILTLMENTSIICDPKFSIDKMAELVQSNRNYVSQVINNALKKNFRSFLNSYRIQEAQRLFSESDATKYTIESVALGVGFKSQSSFRDAFKEMTGISPNFYLKSMQKL